MPLPNSDDKAIISSPANAFNQTHTLLESDTCSAQENQRLHLQTLRQPSEQATPVGHNVIQGLSQAPKTIPPQYFYDDRGSQLFEQICELPEYYVTRTETAILETCAMAIAQQTGSCELVELGSGSSTKTRLLLNAYAATTKHLRYLPIDVSAGILKDSAIALLTDYPSLKVHGLIGTYQSALQQLPLTSLPTRMIAFIGSTLGNLPPVECDRFLQQIRNALNPGEYFLLGVDLQKPVAILEAAYNDAQGVTADFNLNMLHHLNHRFSGNFDVAQFEHRAWYNSELHQIEMHLRSRIDQTITLADLDYTFTMRAGETILSEISRKFNLTQLQTQLKQHGFSDIQTWTDSQQWFGLMLAQVGT